MAHKVTAWRYVAVWGGLCALTFATFALHEVIGRREPLSLIVAMTIALVKSALVALFFMELWEHRGANRLVLAISIAFVLLLMGLSIADVQTRYPLAVPPRDVPAQAQPPP
jgi:cytochrome c oxidase subunit IV